MQSKTTMLEVLVSVLENECDKVNTLLILARIFKLI